MSLPHIYFVQELNQDQVKIKFTPQSSRKIDSHLEQELKTAWNNLVEIAEKNHKKIWDSQLYRLENVNLDSKALNLNLTLSTIPFSIRKMITSFLPQVIVLGDDYYSHGLFSSTLVNTTDNLYCFLKKSAKYEARNTYSFVGGTLARSEKILNTGSDLFLQAQKELLQEINVKPENITNFKLISIFTTAQTHACCLFTSSLNLSSQELKQLFIRRHHPESSEIILLPKDQVSQFLRLNLPGDVVKFEILNQLNP